MAGERGKWIKGCESAHCIEVMLGADVVYLSSTQEPEVILVTHEEWAQFLQAAKQGKFDL